MSNAASVVDASPEYSSVEVATELLAKTGLAFEEVFIRQNPDEIQRIEAQAGLAPKARAPEELGPVFETTWGWLFEVVSERSATYEGELDQDDLLRATALNAAIYIAEMFDEHNYDHPNRPFAINKHKNEIKQRASIWLSSKTSMINLAGWLESVETDAPEVAEPEEVEVADAVVVELNIPTPTTEAPEIPVRAARVPRAPKPKGVRRPTRAGKEFSPDDPVRQYLSEIGQYPLLVKEDEVRLSKQVQAGLAAREVKSSEAWESLPVLKRRQLEQDIRLGDRAKEHFVNCNLRLVVSIAKRYQASGVPLLDLIQSGNIGMMHSVEKFDWQKGFKFSTYATWWIRQAIERDIVNTGSIVRIPVHLADTLKKLNKHRGRIEREEGRRATIDELADAMDIDTTKVEELLVYSANQVLTSLDAELSDDSSSTYADLIADPHAERPDEAAESAMLPDYIEDMLRILSPREREIIILRYGLDRGQPRTLEEVGEYFGLTRERIRQIEAKTLSRLRHPSNPGSMLFVDYSSDF